MAVHWSKEHGEGEEKGEKEMYRRMGCHAFLTSNLPITQENFVDFEDQEKEPGAEGQEESTAGGQEEENQEISFESMEVLGYKCGVVECGKVSIFILSSPNFPLI